jgi:lipopolysaccharide export system permease protein
MAFDERGVDLVLELFNGKVHEYKTAEITKIQITRFQNDRIRVRNVQNIFERDTINFNRGDREMTTCEMMDHVSASRRRAQRANALRRDLATQDLRNLMRVNHTGRSTPISDSTVVQHCGAWRGLERAIGKLLLPQVVQAQQPARPASPALPPNQQPPNLVIPVVDSSARTPPIRQDAPIVLTNLSEILSATQDQRSALVSADRYLVEIHKKYTISVACFSFVLIGVALALRFPRGGMGLVIGGGLLIFAIFYVGLVGGESLADRGFVSPAVAMWSPNVIVVLVGIIGLFRVSREFGSTRGGDLADLVDILIRPFRFRRKA